MILKRREFRLTHVAPLSNQWRLSTQYPSQDVKESVSAEDLMDVRCNAISGKISAGAVRGEIGYPIVSLTVSSYGDNGRSIVARRLYSNTKTF
ncbi:hypothetical protein AVEN_156984-1 [Araneus ventricosus]|uniref:Uncharacterized protein n=1 Tax=Araneus ventricosus TaxID=182803 RepID=A0A4Y2SEV2_ARAVE|nr:hypothetical protein AVEN_156984-1 [Araneus ventricosus]